MILRSSIHELEERAAELKLKGDFHGLLPLREELARLLEARGAGVKAVADAYNYVAYVNRQIGDFSSAEGAARYSLSYYRGHSVNRDEALATYVALLSMILQDQGRFADALPFAEECLEIFASVQGESEFVAARRAEVAAIREHLR